MQKSGSKYLHLTATRDDPPESPNWPCIIHSLGGKTANSQLFLLSCLYFLLETYFRQTALEAEPKSKLKFHPMKGTLPRNIFILKSCHVGHIKSLNLGVLKKIF